MKSNKKKVKLLIYAIVVILIATFTTLFISCVDKSNDYDAVKSDAIIVLGYSLDDGENPSDFLIKRMETTLLLFNQGYAKNIIVSGGIGPTDTVPVAVSMKKWFIEKGVPSTLIFTESYSNNTYENFVYSKEICDENGFNDVIVVTNDFHIHRAMLIGSEFFTNISGEEAYVNKGFTKFTVYLKEPLSIVKYELLNKGTYEKVLNKKNDNNGNLKSQKSLNEKYEQIYQRDDITLYDIKINYDDKNNLFNCVETVTFTNYTNKTLDTIKLNLYHNRLKNQIETDKKFLNIDSVASGKNMLNFKDNVSDVDIEIPKLKPNDKITFEISFTASIPKISYMSGSDDNSIWAKDFFPIVSEFKDGEFISGNYSVENGYNKMSNYKIAFQSNSDYTVILPNLTTSKTNGLTKTTSMNTTLLRNLSFAITKDIRKTSLKSDYGVDVSFYYKTESHVLYNLLHIAEKSMNYMNNSVGIYPYNSLKIVEVSLDLPIISYSSGIIFIDKDFLSNPNVKNELMYGIISQWFGMVVSSNSIDTSYIHTGLSRLLSETIYNTESSVEEHFNLENKMLQLNYDDLEIKNLDANSSDFKDYDSYYTVKHLKSKLMLYDLQNKLNSNDTDSTQSDKWLDFLKTYYNSYSFNIVDDNDFKILANEFSKENLKEFFDSWVTEVDDSLNTQGGTK